MLTWIASTLLLVHGAVLATIPKIEVKITTEPADLSKYLAPPDLRSVRTTVGGDPEYRLAISVTQRIDCLYVRATLSSKDQTLSDHEHTCVAPACLDVRSAPARLREEVTSVLDETLFKDKLGFGYLILVNCDGPFQREQHSAVLNVDRSSILVIERGFYQLWWYDSAKHALAKETIHYLEPTSDTLQELTKARFTTARGSVTPATTPKWLEQFCATKFTPMTTPQFALVMQLRPPDPTSRTVVPNNGAVIGK